MKKKKVKINCGIIETMQKLVDKHVKTYKSDFFQDCQKIKKLGIGKYYFLVREHGTYLFTEEEMQVKNGDAFRTFFFYLEQNYKNIHSYVVNIKNITDDVCYGDIYNIPYDEKTSLELSQNFKEPIGYRFRFNEEEPLTFMGSKFNYYEVLDFFKRTDEPLVTIVKYLF